jgi:hypothetical protein
VELDGRPLRPAVELGDAGPLAERLDPDDRHQRVDLRRQRAEAVDELRREALHLDLLLEPRQAAVEAEADVEVGDVILGDEDGDAEIDLGAPVVVLGQADLAGAELLDRLLQHVLVKLEADLAHVAGLLLADQVAGAADVHVLAREREAGAEALERAEHAQPLLGLRREPCAARW